MNIVVVGAGKIGRYISSVLSDKEHNVILLDKDPKKLEQASWTSDIATKEGSAVDWQLLDSLLDLTPDFLIALTDSDETNLVACSIAKHLGYPRTIARVRDNRFLNRARLDFSQIFDVDYFLFPELLVANDILKYLISPGSIYVESFAHGAAQMRTIEVPENWKKSHVPLSELKLPKGVIAGLICRGCNSEECGACEEVIFPHGNDFILPGDAVTFIGDTEAVSLLHKFLGIKQKEIKLAVVAGNNACAVSLAKLLETKNVSVIIIEKDYENCKSLAEKLPNSVVINHDATDSDFLRAEKIGDADVFVACTSNDEFNLAAAALGKEVGCKEVVATLSNVGYRNMATQMGVNYAISPLENAADHILPQIQSKTVSSLVSLCNNRAEVVEILVSEDCKLVGIPLSKLGSMLPKDFLITVIQNRGRVMIADGTRILSPGDTVIVMTSPKHVSELEQIF